jgi:hypothetical protein
MEDGDGYASRMNPWLKIAASERWNRLIYANVNVLLALISFVNAFENQDGLRKAQHADAIDINAVWGITATCQ